MLPSLLILGCASLLRGPPAPLPPADVAPCAAPIADTPAAVALDGAPDAAALRAVRELGDGPISVRIPASLAYRHVVALARAAGPGALEVRLAAPEGQLAALPLRLGELDDSPWDGALPALGTPAPRPAWPVSGSGLEAAVAGAAVLVLLDGEQAWVSQGDRRAAVRSEELAEAVGGLGGPAETPVMLLDATAETPWGEVVLGLSALACSAGDEAPAPVYLGYSQGSAQ